MRDYSQIGREIIEQILAEVNPETGPCFFPGKFKPPHKGHFEAANYLANDKRVNIVYVVISNVEKFGITADDSLSIWTDYLKSKPNNKIKVMKSTEGTPIRDIFRFAANNQQLKSIYVAAAKEESEDLGYFKKLQEQYPNVKKIIIPDQFGRISATQMRAAIKSGDYDEFAKFVPTAAYNSGVTKDIFGMLTKIIQ
jgi:nicotinic acid mononucleotide adenylyltransferase